MRPSADRYTPDDTADRPTSSAGSGFAEAYRVHRPGLVKLAAFVVGDQATGEDVVQDVFTRLHQRWDRQVHRGPRTRGPRSRTEGDPMIPREEMDAIADRLTDALTAAAAIMPSDEAHTLSGPVPGRPASPASRPVRRRMGRLRAWLDPGA
jgi:hypothetical protein